MIRRLVQLVSDLRGLDRSRYVELLERQLEATREAIELIDRALLGTVNWTAARGEISAIEHRGDAARAELVEQLARSLVTPVDREDLFRISRSVDDVLDNLRDLVRACDLLGAADPLFLRPLVAQLDLAVVALATAIRAIASDPSQVGHHVLAAKKAAGEIRRSYDEALAGLFAGEISVEMLKQRELLRRLDVVGLRLREAADALADAKVKRGET